MKRFEIFLFQLCVWLIVLASLGIVAFAPKVLAQTTPPATTPAVNPAPIPPPTGGVVVYMPLSGTNTVQQTYMILVAPGVMAVANLVQANAVFQTCMAQLNAVTWNCNTQYTNSIQSDIATRWQAVVKALYSGLPAGTTIDNLLAANKLYFVVGQQ